MKSEVLKQLKHDIEKLKRDKEASQDHASISSLIEEKPTIKLQTNSQLPPRDPNFVGRKNEIEFILASLKDRKHCAIVGNGGIGKSAITTELLHIIQEQSLYRDGILWIKLEKEQTLDQVVEEQMIEQIGVELNRKKLDRELKKLLFGKNILVIFDSAEQNEVITNQLFRLFKEHTILITSRQQFDDVYTIQLNRLNAEESLKLFEKQLGKEIDAKERGDIEAFCVHQLGGLPLAIKIIANYMRTTRRNLHEIQYSLKILHTPMYDHFRDERVSIHTIFELSYQSLSADEQRIFAMGAIFLHPFREERLLEIIQKFHHKPSIMAEMDALVAISLIERDREGLYRYHPLVREYALEKLQSLEESKEILEAKKEYLVTLSAKEENLPEIYPELLDVVDEDLQSNNHERAFRVIENLDWWLSKQGVYHRRKELLQKGYQRAKQVQDRIREYIFLRSYADVFNRRGEYQKAKELFNKALAFDQSKEDFGLHYSLHTIEYRLGHHETTYAKNLTYAREALFHDDIQYSGFLRTNGWICNNFLELDKSLIYAKSSVFAKKDRSNNFKALIDLVKVYFYQNRYENVLNFINILEGYFDDREFGVADKVEIQVMKAWVYLYQGNHSLLEVIYQIERDFNLLEFGYTVYDELREIEMFYHLQHGTSQDACCALEAIKDEEQRAWCQGIYDSYHEIDRAKEFFEEFLKKNKKQPKNIATAKLYLAKLYAKHGEYDDAIKLLMEAKSFWQSSMNPLMQKIKKEIIDLVSKERYDRIQSKMTVEEHQESFFLEKLPKSISAKDGKEMVLISEGLSICGSDYFPIPSAEEIFEDVEMVLNNDKRLSHIRYLWNFYIDKEPVTNREYLRYCEEANVEIPDGLETQAPDQPVQNLTLQQMQGYAEFYDKRLPLPEEWERACRGPKSFNYPWGNAWNGEIEAQIDTKEFQRLQELLLGHESFEEYMEWVEHYQKDQEHDDLGFLERVPFDDWVEVDRFYFFKLLLNSLVDIEMKLFTIEKLSTIWQFQVDRAIEIFENELKEMKKLLSDEPDNVEESFQKAKEGAMELLGLLALEQKREIASLSPYGVANMVGNGFELTLKRDEVILKGDIVTYNPKEQLKAKRSFFITEPEKFSYYHTTFRCVKPIFSIKDIEDLKS